MCQLDVCFDGNNQADFVENTQVDFHKIGLIIPTKTNMKSGRLVPDCVKIGWIMNLNLSMRGHIMCLCAFQTSVWSHLGATRHFPGQDGIEAVDVGAGEPDDEPVVSVRRLLDGLCRAAAVGTVEAEGRRCALRAWRAHQHPVCRRWVRSGILTLVHTRRKLPILSVEFARVQEANP